MRSGTQSVSASAAIRLADLTVVLLLCAFSQVAAENRRGTIICREEVSALRRLELTQKLQLITGWPDLRFESSGSLQPGANKTDGGSDSARNLIIEALNSGKVLIIEDASNRADVVFARVVAGRWKNGSSQNPIAFVVMIDFADFDSLMGDRQALAAFNVGWALLHEIDHVVNDSEDSKTANRVGGCEDHINRMRRECHLPARLDYYFRFYPNSENSDFRTRLVRLAFQQDDSDKKHKLFWVIWDATQVGGLEALRQVATL